MARVNSVITSRRFLAFASLAIFAALSAVSLGSISAKAATSSAKTAGSKELTFYSVVEHDLYINHADDRARGDGHNPFGNVATAISPSNEKAYGPLPGDDGEFESNLYTSASHKSSAGSSIFVCQYNFDQDAFCDASFQLQGGTLIGKGAFSFNASKTSFAIVGGTSAYRNMEGVVEVSGLGPGTLPQPVARIVPMLEASRLTFVLKPSRDVSSSQFVEYSNPAGDAFLSMADDELRGSISNAFGTHISKAAAGLADLDEQEGPFPGDKTLFSFRVYPTGSLNGKAESAVYTCQYYFDKNAFCDASFALNGGTLFGAGAFNFNAKTYALAITGGYGKYTGVTGDIEADPSGKLAQRLDFQVG